MAGVPVYFLLVVAAVGVLILGGLLVLLLLLVNEKTRAAGVVLLVMALLGAPVVIGGGALLLAWPVARSADTPVGPAPSVQFDPPAEYEPLASERVEANETDQPEADENGLRQR
jgi:hypothetical protein